jgi:hypothetical protein
MVAACSKHAQHSAQMIAGYASTSLSSRHVFVDALVPDAWRIPML